MAFGHHPSLIAYGDLKGGEVRQRRGTPRARHILSPPVTVAEVSRKILAWVEECTQAEQCALLLWSASEGEVRVVASRGCGLGDHEALWLEQMAIETCSDSREEKVECRVVESAWHDRPIGQRSFLFQRVGVAGQTIGVLQLSGSASNFVLLARGLVQSEVGEIGEWLAHAQDCEAMASEAVLARAREVSHERELRHAKARVRENEWGLAAADIVGYLGRQLQAGESEGLSNLPCLGEQLRDLAEGRGTHAVRVDLKALADSALQLATAGRKREICFDECPSDTPKVICQRLPMLYVLGELFGIALERCDGVFGVRIVLRQRGGYGDAEILWNECEASSGDCDFGPVDFADALGSRSGPGASISDLARSILEDNGATLESTLLRGECCVTLSLPLDHEPRSPRCHSIGGS